MSYSQQQQQQKVQPVRLIWHRRDLRLEDNTLYSDLAVSSSSASIEETEKACLSLYIFDDTYFTPRPSTSSPKEWDSIYTGPHSTRILVEAVTELRQSLRSIGGDLLVRSGDPYQIIPLIAEEIGATEICWNEEPGTYETRLSDKLKQYFVQKSAFPDYDDNYGDDSEAVSVSSSSSSRMKIKTDIGYTLYHPEDLPFDANVWSQLAHPKQKHKNRKKKNKSQPQTRNPVSRNHQHEFVDISVQRFRGMCKVMGDFRKAARSSATNNSPRKTIPAPTSLSLPSRYRSHYHDDSRKIEEGVIPSMRVLMVPLLEAKKPIIGMDAQFIASVIDHADTSHFSSNSPSVIPNVNTQKGGESHALKRLNFFIDNGHASIADRSRADVSNDNSSRFSVHLAHGTISPRTIYEKANSYEAGEGAKWIKSHLEMRDFFLYTAFASGDQLFHQEGIPVRKIETPLQWADPAAEDLKWSAWALGNTGLPLVDAAMRELISTGYCSNRVRQNVASVLTKDLGIDWRAGAEWFQFLLEDHCVGANWGNWLYFSGVGPDPKNRHFRTTSQSLKYDNDGSYIKRWMPELWKEVGGEDEGIFRPWDFARNWKTVVDPKTQLTWNDLERYNESGNLRGEE